MLAPAQRVGLQLASLAQLVGNLSLCGSSGESQHREREGKEGRKAKGESSRVFLVVYRRRGFDLVVVIFASGLLLVASLSAVS